MNQRERDILLCALKIVENHLTDYNCEKIYVNGCYVLQRRHELEINGEVRMVHL